MKLLLVLLAVLCLVVMLSAALRPKTAAPQPQRTTGGGFFGGLNIMLLRIVRGALVLVTLVTAALAFRLLLVVGATAHANIHSPGAWHSVLTAVVLLAGIVALFWFLFWALRRLRLKVNQMHRERHDTAALLLVGAWSL